MKGDKYVIVKAYKIFRGDSTTGEPMDEQSEQLLFSWLRTGGGFAEAEARKIVEDVDHLGELKITLP
jgi:hypothetical protein